MVLRVLHLVGSAVSEFYCDLSRLYAQDCLESTADPELYEFHVAYVTPGGRWRFPTDLSPEAISSATSVSLAEAVRRLTELGIDVMVPQMFCVPGMTYYRALFDLLEIPYVGNTPDAMALGSDKAKAKGVVATAGVSVPRGEVLRAGDDPTVPPPAVIKPVDTDNSLGITLACSRAEYDAALEKTFDHSDAALLEKYIELGREVRCGVVVQDGQPVPLPLEEYDVDSTRKPIRSYEDKINRNEAGGLNLVAKDSTRSWIVDTTDPVTQPVWEAARRCHVALGCRHYSLFDFRVDPSGQPWFLEAGLYCSFARKSVISVMARAAGMPLEELFRMAVSQAIDNK